MILVYFSVSERDRHKNIRNDIEKILEEYEGPLLIGGGFNGYVGFKGKQVLDSNRKMIIDWMEKYRMMMLKEDEKCKGEHTWSDNGKNSYRKHVSRFLMMETDEEEFDSSDHNLVR